MVLLLLSDVVVATVLVATREFGLIKWEENPRNVGTADTLRPNIKSYDSFTFSARSHITRTFFKPSDVTMSCTTCRYRGVHMLLGGGGGGEKLMSLNGFVFLFLHLPSFFCYYYPTM